MESFLEKTNKMTVVLGAGTVSGVDLVDGSGAALETYGGKDVGDSEDIIESGIIEPLLLDQVNNIQGLYNEVNHHYY